MREQDQDGIDAEILYTHPSYLNSWRGISDDEPYVAMIHAYNEWLIEEYCSLAPDRLVGTGIIPDTNLSDAIAELKFCAKVGYKKRLPVSVPQRKGFPAADDDKFWAAAMDLGMPVTAHTNGGTTRFLREGPVYSYNKIPERAVPGRDPISLLFRFSNDNPIRRCSSPSPVCSIASPNCKYIGPKPRRDGWPIRWRRSMTITCATGTGRSEIGGSNRSRKNPAII